MAGLLFPPATSIARGTQVPPSVLVEGCRPDPPSCGGGSTPEASISLCSFRMPETSPCVAAMRLNGGIVIRFSPFLLLFTVYLLNASISLRWHSLHFVMQFLGAYPPAAAPVALDA
ncbi:hypothetical protein LI328DRAFT_12666 [Trichoderma asperelloides]|nr:hypothetical protein LI328DRAFT_12666 [Trichoderma asperelloides]